MKLLQAIASYVGPRVCVLAQAMSHLPTSSMPIGHNSALADPFERLAALLCRYKNAYEEQGKRTVLENHGATPDAHLRAMQAGVRISIERFASPLDFCTGYAKLFQPIPSRSGLWRKRKCLRLPMGWCVTMQS